MVSMTGRLLRSAFLGWLCFGLAGCSVPIGWYHDVEGGAIAQQRQPPPGSDQPYPNLANVPPQPAALPGNAAASISAAVHGTATGVSPASPGALAGLELPGAPPPLPDVPGMEALPASPSTPPVPAAPPAPPPPNGPPIALGFPPHSAVLPFTDIKPIEVFAKARGGANILVGGFGDGTSLSLALARAQRLADALTADGVPPGAIRLVAQRAGSGGFAQLVY